MTCAALDACHLPGTCNPSTGTCSNPGQPNGFACDDGNACTQTDTCQNAACVGASPVVCSALNPCHAAGTCDPATGTCSNPAQPNGFACSDGDACTQPDTCQAGACTSGPVDCGVGASCVAGACVCGNLGFPGGGAITAPVGSEPRSVAAADVNGDGKPDLAVANTSSNSASVLLNTCLP